MAPDGHRKYCLHIRRGRQLPKSGIVMTHPESSSSLLHRTWRAAAFRTSSIVSSVVCAPAFAWALQNPSDARTVTGGNPKPLPAPEINPALIVGAVVLVVGGLLILTGRRRRAAKIGRAHV